jgi:hypothetical protein
VADMRRQRGALLGRFKIIGEHSPQRKSPRRPINEFASDR